MPPRTKRKNEESHEALTKPEGTSKIQEADQAQDNKLSQEQEEKITSAIVETIKDYITQYPKMLKKNYTSLSYNQVVVQIFPDIKSVINNYCQKEDKDTSNDKKQQPLIHILNNKVAEKSSQEFKILYDPTFAQIATIFIDKLTIHINDKGKILENKGKNKDQKSEKININSWKETIDNFATNIFPTLENNVETQVVAKAITTSTSTPDDATLSTQASEEPSAPMEVAAAPETSATTAVVPTKATALIFILNTVKEYIKEYETERVSSSEIIFSILNNIFTAIDFLAKNNQDDNPEEHDKNIDIFKNQSDYLGFLCILVTDTNPVETKQKIITIIDNINKELNSKEEEPPISPSSIAHLKDNWINNIDQYIANNSVDTNSQNNKANNSSTQNNPEKEHPDTPLLVRLLSMNFKDKPTSVRSEPSTILESPFNYYDLEEKVQLM